MLTEILTTLVEVLEVVLLTGAFFGGALLVAVLKDKKNF